MAYDRTRARERSAAATLPWVAVTASVIALAAAVTAALITGRRVDRLRAEKEALTDRTAALESANAELKGKQKDLTGKLKNAREDTARLEGKLLSEKRVRELAAQAAKAELARRRPAAPARDPEAAVRVRENVGKAADDIAAIRKKVEKKEITPEEGRKAVAEKIKKVLPPDVAERLEKARAEREKNMTPEEKKQAEKGREAVLDGIADMVEIQKKVKDGEMTREEARKAIQEKWRARMEQFRKGLPEDQRKKWEERMKARRKAREDRAKPPEVKEEF